MTKHSDPASPPPVTYTARPPIVGQTLTCERCKRVHAYPEAGGPVIRCECGWRYENERGTIREAFTPRLGV
ncbi:MAG: hypothetical protein NVS3B17_04900 [Vulcanimicrobiaceae bacterium]